jgi:cytochrome b6-f complex iron-sulfur subunit
VLNAISDVGSAVLVEASVGGIHRFILVARTSDDLFAAVNGVCTHEGCTVSLSAGCVYVCPCHGSRYTRDGEVVQGPAPAALPRFAIRREGDRLYIEL